jgi:hypothetical protein
MACTRLSGFDEKYLLAEYRQIMTAYNNSHDRRYSLLRLYLTLITVPSSILAVVSNVQTTVFSVSKDAISFFFVLLTAVGLSILNSLISIRQTHVGYAKAINAIRGYFDSKSKDTDFKHALVLPKSALEPKYFVVGSHFFDTLSVAVLNGVLVAYVSYLTSGSLPLSLDCWFLAVVLQVVFYYFRLSSKDRRWTAKAPVGVATPP